MPELDFSKSVALLRKAAGHAREFIARMRQEDLTHRETMILGMLEMTVTTLEGAVSIYFDTPRIVAGIKEGALSEQRRQWAEKALRKKT